MDAPGMSLFQGGGNLELNTSAQHRQEEQEALEDQLRLQREVQAGLAHAFDDLSDDNDDTVASSVRCTSTRQQHNDDINQFISKKTQNTTKPAVTATDDRRLQNECESLSREVQHYRNLLEQQKIESDRSLNELQKRLSLSEAERERAIMSRQQTHELLVDSKQTISEQANLLSKNQEKLAALEKQIGQLETDLNHRQIMLSDVQAKYQMVERNIGLTADRQTDQYLRQQQERHAAKVDLLQEQLNGLREELENKDRQLKRADSNYKELQRTREALLVEKAETINQLSKTIEDSQRQCQQLMANGDYVQENCQLKNTINSLSRQNEELQQSVGNLTRKLEVTNSELQLLDSVIYKNGDTSLSSTSPPTGTPIEDRVTRLRTELSRCIYGQKEKRETIKQLEEQLSAKNDEIKRLKDDENKALIQMMQYKDESARLANRLKCLQATAITNESNSKQSTMNEEHEERAQEFRQKIDELDDRCHELTAENENLRRDVNYVSQPMANDAEAAALKKEICRLEQVNVNITTELNRAKTLYTELSSAKDRLSDELTRARTENDELSSKLHRQIAELEQRIADVNEASASARQCSKCIGHMTQVAKLNIDCLQWRTDAANYQKQISDQQTVLAESKATILELRERATENERLLVELQSGARKFEEYIRQQEEHSSSQLSATSSSVARETEQKMAKILAAKIKAIEMQFAEQMDELRKRGANDALELNETRHALALRSKEVELLKRAILGERKQMATTLANRDVEERRHVDESMKKLREDWHATKSELDRLQQEHARCDRLSEAQKAAVEQLMRDSKQQKLREDNLNVKLTQLERDRAHDGEVWQRKYLAAKKTAAHYKKYAEDKDAHIEQENERIKNVYEAAIKKIQQKYSGMR